MARSDAGHNKRLNLIRALELEFDEPLADIVMGMRQQGCSWATVAGALSISSRTLRRWRRDIGFSPINRRDAIFEDRPRMKVVDSIAQLHGYDNFENMYRDMRLSQNMTVRQMSQKTGICERTITKWTPIDLKGIEIKTEKKVASARENLVKARIAAQAAKSSPWYELRG